MAWARAGRISENVERLTTSEESRIGSHFMASVVPRTLYLLAAALLLVAHYIASTQRWGYLQLHDALVTANDREELITWQR